MFDKIYEKLRYARDHGSCISRFGLADEAGEIIWYQDNVCFASLRRGGGKESWQKAKYIFSVYNGEGEIEDVYNHNRNKFTRGPNSDRWLQFILDPVISPWRAIHPHLVSLDFDTVVETGFILKDLDQLPFTLAYNFLIGARFGHEFPQKMRFWVDLMDNHGVAPAEAFLICLNFSNGGVPAPILIQPAGFRRDPADRRRNLRDADGEPIWFPAEYAPVDPNAAVPVRLKVIHPNGHEPLPGIIGYSRRVLSGKLNEQKLRWKIVQGDAVPYGSAWDIFKTAEDGSPRDMEKLMGATLQDALDYLNKFRD